MPIKSLVSSWKESRAFVAKNDHRNMSLSGPEIVFLLFCIYGLLLTTPFRKKDEDAA